MTGDNGTGTLSHRFGDLLKSQLKSEKKKKSRKGTGEAI